ncbi:hypothetical protein [Sphingorhabdus sp. 109]|uniref:hypothetical protein n=1 Tax=Sphingorhabdus sp. 109 TaxID=2653173 RepID=UPI0012F0A8F4|nr:hypothetical protein [Sphingorhabdus sp. 109]VWX61191.1 conserved hypothetical protein [Sphingorhabdus sp. 109]
MVDNLSIALTHGLLLIAAWRLMHRDDLDVEPPPERDKEPIGFAKQLRPNESQPDA